MFLHTLFSNLIISLIDVKRLAPRSQNMWKQINESPKNFFLQIKIFLPNHEKKHFNKFLKHPLLGKNLKKQCKKFDLSFHWHGYVCAQCQWHRNKFFKYLIIWIGGSDERYSNTVLVNNKIVPLKKQLMYSLKQEVSLIVLEFTISVHSSSCNYLFFGLTSLFLFLDTPFCLKDTKEVDT